MTIYFESGEETAFAFDPESQLKRVISTVRDYVKCPYDVEVSVTMADRDQIRQANAQFRGIDRATDVLSFPMMEYDRPADFDGPAFCGSAVWEPDTGELVLGDIVLCAQIVREQAREYGHSELREFSFLAVHSMLHLFGYDHIEEEERTCMEREQRAIMELLGIGRSELQNG